MKMLSDGTIVLRAEDVAAYDRSKVAPEENFLDTVDRINRNNKARCLRRRNRIQEAREIAAWEELEDALGADAMVAELETPTTDA